jgi:hypothetical protein
VSVKALRRREGMGLIYTLGRRSGCYRLFDESAVACVQSIRGLRALGLTEAEIAELAAPTTLVRTSKTCTRSTWAAGQPDDAHSCRPRGVLVRVPPPAWTPTVTSPGTRSTRRPNMRPVCGPAVLPGAPGGATTPEQGVYRIR